MGYPSPLLCIPRVKTIKNLNKEPSSFNGPKPSADQSTLHTLQTKKRAQPTIAGGSEGDIAKLFRSYIASSLPGWPNPGRHLVGLSYLDNIDGGLPTDMKGPRSSVLKMLNRENKSFCWGISVNSAL